MRVLDLKLFRDLWRIRGQALAITLVQASGISLLVMSLGMIASLSITRDAYYDRYRFADVFATATRVPELVLNELRGIEGVNAVEGRVMGLGLVDLPQLATPVTAQFVSRPTNGSAPINNVYLVKGREPDPVRRDEILLLDAFAKAHALEPGDTLTVIAYGAKRTFTIVGIALSPEFIYAVAPGAPTVDIDRFAVIWAPYETLAPTFNLDGAFNEAVFKLARGADAASVIPEIDRILAPYGGRGAYGRDDQVSNKFLAEELRQFETMSFIMTPIFMGVTIFLLNVVISRMVQTEREQIGLLKAFGYTSVEIGGHYGKFALVLAFAGAAVGWLGGLYLGRVITEVFQAYYHFPFLIFQTDFRTLFYAILLSVLGAGLGAYGSVRGAVRLRPAEAMRPPAPERYDSAGGLLQTIVEALDRPTRMIVRRITRRPLRSMSLALGIGAAMGLSVMMQFNNAAIDHILEASFQVIDRSDMTVGFSEPLGEKAAVELAQLDGVQLVEPFRSAAVTFVQGRTERLGAITGLQPEPVINRALDENLRPVKIPQKGLLLSTSLAKILDVGVGDLLEVRFKEGRQPTLEIEVVGLMDVMLGTPAYMAREDLNRRLMEPGRMSGAYLRVEPEKMDAIKRRTKEIPKLASVDTRLETLRNFEDLLAQGPGTFRLIMTFFSTVIAIGVVYNGARITFSERQYDLASLRILGFSKAESGYVVTGEILVLALAALPIGCLIGVLLWTYISTALSTELYQIPTIYNPVGFGVSGFTVIIASIVASFLIQRDVNKLDMVSALKARD
ncbi:MAG: FtsX-like permease family protein [Pseudomonadota bacterium]